MLFRKLIRARTIDILLLIMIPLISGALVGKSFDNESEFWPRVLGIVGILVFIGAVFIDFFWYIPYHTRDKPERYFNKLGYENAVSGYQFSRKLFYVVFVIVFLSLVLMTILDNSYPGPIPPILLFLFEFPALTLIVLATRFAFQHLRKDFDFYWAKAYFNVSSTKQDNAEEFKYLILALDTYNKFLERSFKLRISDITRIYSKVMSASSEEKVMIRESIGKALEKDKLELARQLAELLNLEDKGQFLVKEQTILNQGFKDVLTTIIPAIIGIVGFIITTLSQFKIISLGS
jgi:hypothetical protein